MSYNPRVINYQTNINISKITTQNNQPNTYDKNSNLLQRVVPTPANHDFAYNGTDNKTNYTSPFLSFPQFCGNAYERYDKSTYLQTKKNYNILKFDDQLMLDYG